MKTRRNSMDYSENLRDERRRRFHAKQERIVSEASKDASIDDHSTEAHAWRVANCDVYTVVDMTQVKLIQKQMAEKSTRNSSQLSSPDQAPVVSISESLPLLHLLYPYFDLRSNDFPPNDIPPEVGNGHRRHFIAEGTETVRLLIQLSQRQIDSTGSTIVKPVEIESIFLKPNLFFEEPVGLFKDVDKALNRQRKKVNSTPDTPFHVLLGAEAVISEVAGFSVSRGCLACGYVPVHMDEDWFFRFIESRLDGSNTSLRLLALDGISDTANLGSIVRTASALSIHAILLSEDSCDAWYRRSIRVSMGHVFRIPIVRVAKLEQTLLKLMSPPFQVSTYAAVVEQQVKFLLNKLKPGDIPDRWCCVLGNEANGISPTLVRSCHHTIRIDMDDGVDSLSLPIATGILLHGLRERESTSGE